MQASSRTSMTSLEKKDIDLISNTLSQSQSLKLPARLSTEPISSTNRRQYLHALLSHDPGVFLERHGQLLSAAQRKCFEPLRNEAYEVDFFLKLLEDEDKAHSNEAQASIAYL